MSIVIDLREYAKGGKSAKEALNAALELRKTGMFTDEEIQKMYDEQIKRDKRKEEE